MQRLDSFEKRPFYETVSAIARKGHQHPKISAINLSHESKFVNSQSLTSKTNSNSAYVGFQFHCSPTPNTVHDLTGRGIGLKVLTGHGAAIDTTTAAGKLVFGIFAALAEFERELIAERTVAGLASARARGRKGGRPFKMTAAKLRLAMAAMGQSETKVGDLCQELGITRQTLYRHISPKGELRPDGEKLLSRI